MVKDALPIHFEEVFSSILITLFGWQPPPARSQKLTKRYVIIIYYIAAYADIRPYALGYTPVHRNRNPLP
jgi:hypothetical protein